MTTRPAIKPELSLEKSLAAMFARSYKPYSFGAFGKPTPQYLRAALAKNRIVLSYHTDGTLSGAAIFTLLRTETVHQDFSHRACLLPRGSLYVKHMAVAPIDTVEAIASLIEKLVCRTQGAPIWLEIHEENELIRHEIENRFGFNYVMSKIMASSDIRALYLRGGVVNLPRLHPTDTPSLMCLNANFLSLAERSGILQELEKYAICREPWTQHYSHYNRRRSWTAFALRGYCGDEPGFVAKPAEMSKRWKSENPKLLSNACDDTIAARFFPITVNVVKRIPGSKERVRFMRLASLGGELSRHADVTDREAGTADGCVTRLHIPLVTHEDVLFESWGLRGEHHQMHFATSGLYYLDQRKPHRVVNRSPVERIHLVVDTYSSQELRDLMVQ